MYTKENFGKTNDAQDVYAYTLKNKNGLSVKIINYGGIIVSINTPDKNGLFKDIVLGFENLNGYLENNYYFGCIIGRYSNRIDKGHFKIDGIDYQLNVNNGLNHLHGGFKGFDKALWDSEIIENGQALKLNYLSKDGEENYSGNLKIEVIYLLNDNNELEIKYQATTDKKTIINLTNHTYFNLLGSGNILNHKLYINSDKYTPINENLIVTGEIKDVKDTPMDFTNLENMREIGLRIKDDFEQLVIAKGYDHNFVINKSDNNLAAKVYEEVSGRVIEMFTTEPALQFYSGNFLDSVNVNRKNQDYIFPQGFCLEAQHFPDSPNKKHFPTAILNPNEIYNQRTIYKFGVL